MIEPGLDGKVVLVTGANNPYGIGVATAKAFAAQDARVFIHFFRSPNAHSGAEQVRGSGSAFFQAQQGKTADEVLDAIRRKGGQAAAWEADLSDPENIPKLFDQVEAVFGPVDILVNNAAAWKGDTFLTLDAASGKHFPIPTISPDSHDHNFAVNSRAVALMMAEYARRFVQRGANWGRIVNVSTDGASAFPGEVSYGASKHAMESYRRAAAIELGPYGITVNVVSPGPVQTGYITPEMEEKLCAEIPLRRVGKPEDVADVIVFLASEQARWITGQLLYVGGGHVMPL
ncbi:MAG: SDR family oxidoreductase [Candidatus Acetothermia bacterium]|jgi:3-oxoacyl-[acyl-carrier protein] reductase|nr:SDR family oxidoreductase [Candidatus Acetothermia bacterium]MDH7505109.1 SDR family oxidoreductase [Candidatus Acetothermia bacterium]